MPPIRVLIVDDSVVVRRLLCEAVAPAPGIKVAGTASTGAIALARIPQLNPDIITLDIEMPGLNGIQTLKEIRKLYPKLPVIMCSTLTEHGAATTLEALAAGASDYVTKPSNSSSLAHAMGQLRQELVTKITCLAGHRYSIPAPAISPFKRKAPVARHRHSCHRNFHWRTERVGGSDPSSSARSSRTGRGRAAHAAPVHAHAR
jgi:two-component system chemotaxis response regulator CheB